MQFNGNMGQATQSWNSNNAQMPVPQGYNTNNVQMSSASQSFIPSGNMGMNVNTQEFNKQSSMNSNVNNFIPGTGSVPGTHQAPPAYNPNQ